MPAHPAIWFVNATQAYSALPLVCQQAGSVGQLIHVLIQSRDREAILQLIPPESQLVRLVEITGREFDLHGFDTDSEIIFLPCVEGTDWTGFQQRPPLVHSHCIQPLVATMSRISPLHYTMSPVDWFGWRAGAELARRIFREPSAWQSNGVELVEAIQRWPDPPRWQSIPLHAPRSDNYPRSSPPSLTRDSIVLVVISFYACEEWLHACLTSISQQSRPPENIVVIDDSSPALPLKILEPFPNVTLLSTTRNVGPEKILNNIIRATHYDGYLVQDADDWSSHDRLELSLQALEESGAGMVGTHDLRIDLPGQTLELCAYPPDVNYAMARGLAHYILHCTTLIARPLAMRIGGFDDRLKVAADTDFVFRACHAGQLINLPSFCLFHRTRAGSMTTHDITGHQSVTRIIEDRFIKVRGRRNADLVQAGKTPDIIVKQKEPVTFLYHQGPKLRLSTQAQDEKGIPLTAITGM
jgi:hypothetical protein